MRGPILFLLCWSLLVALPAAALASGEEVPLVTEAKVRELCKALQPVERQVFAGNAGARAQAKTAFEKDHDRLRKTRFVLELPWGGFTVGEWDDAEKVIHLSTERPFRAFNGILTVFDAGRDDIELEAVPDELETLKTGLAKGTLTLALLFKPAEEEGTSCVASKAKTYALSIDLLGAELRFQGRPVARSNRDDLSPMPSSHGTPTIEVRSAAGQECPACSSDVLDAVVKQAPGFARCYEEALTKKPTLDGSLVFSVVAAKSGDLSVATVIADAVNDPGLLDCSKGVVAKTKSSVKGGESQVLVEFGRK
jgi:hypothetical protein